MGTSDYKLEGYHTVTPYLTIKNAAQGIEFYKAAFGATEVSRLTGDDGKIGWAEIKIGDSLLMLSDEFPDDELGPYSLGGTPVAIHLFVPDADALAARAVAAGAEVLRPVADQVFGVRNGILRDPFGHKWFVATRTEEVGREEIRERFQAALQGPSTQT